jgi:hypothetical protein
MKSLLEGFAALVEGAAPDYKPAMVHRAKHRSSQGLALSAENLTLQFRQPPVYRRFAVCLQIVIDL